METELTEIERWSCVPNALSYVCYAQRTERVVTYEDMRRFCNQQVGQLGFNSKQVKRYIFRLLRPCFRSFKLERGITERGPNQLFEVLDRIRARSPTKTMFMVWCWMKNFNVDHPNTPIDQFGHIMIFNFRDDELFCSLRGRKFRINRRMDHKDIRLVGEIYSFH